MSNVKNVKCQQCQMSTMSNVKNVNQIVTILNVMYYQSVYNFFLNESFPKFWQSKLRLSYSYLLAVCVATTVGMVS